MPRFFAELKRRNVLRVAVAYLVLSWLVVQVGSVLLPTFEAPAWVMRVVVLVLSVGFVVTLVVSWVYELTPEGMKRESEIERTDSITTQTARKLDIAVIVLLIAAIGVAVATRGGMPAGTSAAVSAPAKAGARPSVAVLPFVNMSPLKENEYFADGLSETLLNMLAQVSGLKVAARTSAFAFKDTKTDIREIGRVLNVGTVLEGSVQRAGSKVRITAQLIDVSDGSHLWSQSYDRTLDDIFAIQDEIATAVAKELTRSLMGTAATSAAPKVASPTTHDAKAYDLYLRGLEQRNINSHGSLPEAERLFQEAIVLDAGFAEARTALARTYFLMAETGLLTQRDAAVRVRALRDALIEQKNPSPIAQAYDAILQARSAEAMDAKKFRSIAQTTTLNAIAQAPNTVELYELAALTLRGDDGREAEALAIIDRGLGIDPLSTALLTAKARQLRDMKRFDEALAAFTRIRELAPDSPVGYNGAALVYAERGPYVEAVRWYARSSKIDRQDHELPAAVAQHLLAMGLTNEALPWIKRAEQLNASGSDSRRVRMMYSVQTGDSERALQIAESVIRERRDNRRWIQGTAVSVYTTLMDDAGKSDEALALLRREAPGILDRPPTPPKTRFDFIVLWFGTERLAGTFTEDERQSWIAHIIASTKAQDPEFDPEEGVDGIFLNALRGNHARAAELLDQEFADPGKLPEDWRLVLRSPLASQVVKDPRVVARIAKIEDDFARQATRYRELVASGEIVVP